mmetsp:Transcript_18982/g.33951  ORF Transcript_18982/g.33951 Transcript_18982/m.33951 type:complete len:206 (-) Transcript_18982:862-1479(-)
MLEFLVVHGSTVHISLERLPGDAIGEVVFSRVAEAMFHENFGLLERVVPLKRSAILELTFHEASLSGEKLDHLADRHSRRESVRVHDDVRSHPEVVERHVLLRNEDSNHTFLSVATAELVSELRPASGAHENLDYEVVRLVGSDDHLVHDCLRGAFVARWLRLKHVRGQVVRVDQIFGSLDWHVLVDKHVSRHHNLSLFDYAVRT